MGAGPLPVRRFVRGRSLLHQKSITDARCADSARNSADCALRALFSLKRGTFEGIMNRNKLTNFSERFGLAAALTLLACALQDYQVFARTSSATAQNPSGAKVNSPASASSQNPGDERMFKDIYQEFYDTYRLGPTDEIAIRVMGQPDYSLERVKVSPTGSVYHPLLGDVGVAGLTVSQLIDRFTKDLSEYLIDPKVSVALIEAGSAKIGVLGDVVHPGVLVMSRPMKVLDAIT